MLPELNASFYVTKYAVHVGLLQMLAQAGQGNLLLTQLFKELLILIAARIECIFFHSFYE